MKTTFVLIIVFVGFGIIGKTEFFNRTQRMQAGII